VQHGESSKRSGAARPTSLAQVEAFRDLPPAELADLEQRLVTVEVSRGEILMRQGDPAGYARFVIKLWERALRKSESNLMTNALSEKLGSER